MEAYLIGPDRAPRGRLPWLNVKATPKLNAGGGFTMQVPGESRMATRITEGCRVYINDEAGFSGLITTIERSMTQEGVMNINLTGVLELSTLNYAITWPSPLKPLTAQDTDYYTDTGKAGAVIGSLIIRNVGATAQPERRIPGLTLDPNDTAGTTVTTKTRLDVLLTEAAALADRGGVVLDMVYRADRRIHVTVREPVNRARSLVFRQDNGTLGDWQVSTTIPEATAFILGGQGEGKARLLREYDIPSGDTWAGIRMESFKDQRDAENLAALDAAGKELATATAGSAAVTLTINEGRRVFGRDFNLGDTVSANLAGTIFTDKVQAAEIEWGETGRTVKLTLGKDPDRDNQTPTWVRQIRKQSDAIRRMETI